MQQTKIKAILKKIFSSQTKVLRVWVYVAAIIITLGIIGGSVAGYYLFTSVKALTKLSEEQATSLASTQAELTLLISGNKELQDQLTSQMQKSLQEASTTLADKQMLQKQLASLQHDVSNDTASAKAGDISSIVSNWSGRMARVNCSFNEGDSLVKLRGSGTLTMKDGIPELLTNAHVVNDDGYSPSSCTAYFPDMDKALALDGINIVSGVDKAYIKFANVSDVPVNLWSPITACSAKPSIGDRVVILGFPAVGSTDSITATEGIISGFDDGYYITSAKIEQGNSGGAAILAKNNCFAGIPTLVLKGRLEALARILPI